jgi:hypothetical protein
LVDVLETSTAVAAALRLERVREEGGGDDMVLKCGESWRLGHVQDIAV